MSQAPLRLPLEALAAGERLLDEASAKYLVRVHRRAVGDPFVAFDPQARLQCHGHIHDIRGRSVQVVLQAPQPAQHIPAHALGLLLGLPKPAQLDTVVRAASELGVTQLLLVAGVRSQSQEVSPAQLQRCRRISVAAARQCRRGDLPGIACFTSLAAALTFSDQHFGEPHGDAPQRRFQRWLLSPDSAAALTPAAAPDAGMLLAVGPEGGFSDEELTLFEAAAFQPLRLGAFVLRTETAAMAALGAVIAARQTRR